MLPYIFFWKYIKANESISLKFADWSASWLYDEISDHIEKNIHIWRLDLFNRSPVSANVPIKISVAMYAIFQCHF